MTHVLEFPERHAFVQHPRGADRCWHVVGREISADGSTARTFHCCVGRWAHVS